MDPNQQQPQLQPSGSAPVSASPQSEFNMRPTLPDRNVTVDTIEDAYIRFIFYCNPAIPLTTETTNLREAFRTPPKSGGKIFSTFTIFELVKKFYQKEIRTWTEVTTTLGVEPPDPSKDESTQKVAQYGVRLKKWMNSMHVKSFFEFLMEIPNDYWVKPPGDPNPLAQPVRDGVAIEDDMALRALLPHIRPKRGRKRPAEEDSPSFNPQRTHLSPNTAVDVYGPWSAAPDGRGGWQPDPSKVAGPWSSTEAVQTPLTRWPQSAITPSNRGSFWDDALEPKSAITPSKPKLAAQRRGPKNVSSAWRPGIPDGTRMRGRPPINRTPTDQTSPQYPTGMPTMGPDSGASLYSQATDMNSAGFAMRNDIPQYQPTMPPSTTTPVQQPIPDGMGRPSRPSISLQVPERPPGSVRLATPPPVVMVNGAVNGDVLNDPMPPPDQPDHEAQMNGKTNFPEGVGTATTEPLPHPKDVSGYFFEKVEDRTHVDEILGFLTRALLAADWFDAEGQPAKRGCIEETTALVNTVVEDMWKTAVSPQAFLINLAAMAGGRILLVREARVCRKGKDYEKGLAKYSCEWEYGFGNIRGQYTMEQNVPLSMLSNLEEPIGTKDYSGLPTEALTAEDWKRKYEHTLAEMHKKDRELLDLRTTVTHSLKGVSSKK